MKLQLYWPIKPKFINQKFGEMANLQYYKDNGVPIIGHNGIDFQSKHGQPIYAAHDGVAYYEIDGAQGHGVVVRTNEMFEYNGGQSYFKTIYWHMVDSSKEPQFKSPIEPFFSLDGPGKPVKAGDIIGYANSTGLSTGDHLHFGLKACLQGEPVGVWYNLEQNNGYMGAIDPDPYFNGFYAEDIGKPYQFTKDLSFGMVNIDVAFLQAALNEDPDTAVALSGPGSNGNTTWNFGKLTQAAVTKYQIKHEITPSEGYFGPKTRASLNNR